MTAGVSAVARLTWMRLWRSRSPLVTLLLAAAPPLLAGLVVAAGRNDAEDAWAAGAYIGLGLALFIAAAVLLAPSIGEELETRTYTYLWSRPLRRRVVVFGKLLGIAPALVGLFAISLTVTWGVAFRGEAGDHLGDLARALLAVVLVTGASASFAIAAGTLFPRRPLGMVLGYVFAIERLGTLVAALSDISVPYHAAAILDIRPPGIVPSGDLMDGVIGLAWWSALWLAVAVWRVERTEYALPDA
jgi:ABC-type transport system involved in multi-copper enzyme maturation permease subunit